MEIADIRSTEDLPTLNREISREFVRLYKEFLGRGPTRARTIIREDLVICLMEDSLTKAETKLTEDGKADVVRSIRREFQDSMRDEAKAIVERLTGREVLCLLSDHCPEPDYGVEVLVLAPRPEADADGYGAAGSDETGPR